MCCGLTESVLRLLRKVLSRDIRSLHQRLRVQPVAAGTPADAAGAPAGAAAGDSAASGAAAGSGGSWDKAAASSSRASGPEGGHVGAYHVVLEGVWVSYDIRTDGYVSVRDAWVDPVTGRDRT